MQSKDITIDVTLKVSVDFETYSAIRGRVDEPDQPERIQIHLITAIRKVPDEDGMKMQARETDLSWVLTDEDYDKIEDLILIGGGYD